MFVLLCCAHNGFSVPLFFSGEITETDDSSIFGDNNGIFLLASDEIAPFENSESNFPDKIKMKSYMNQNESSPSISISLGIGTITAFVFLIIKIINVLKHEFRGFKAIKI